MRVAALTAGTGVPEGDFCGRVAEVHARACLVDVADGTLLTLLGADLGSQPHGFTLLLPFGFSFSPMLARGAELAARARVLRLDGVPLTIDLRTVRPWRSNLQALAIDLEMPAVRTAWRGAWEALRADARSEQLATLGEKAIGALRSATRDGDAATARDAMGQLVGLGAGRTPAGDDFLVGYAAGLQASRMSEAIRSFVPTLLNHLKQLSVRTNRLSQLYLNAAAEGEISERLHAVAQVIASGGEAAAVRRVLADALAVGHCSGAAGVLGLLHGSAGGHVVQSDADEAPSGNAGATLPACSPRNANPMQIAPSSR